MFLLALATLLQIGLWLVLCEKYVERTAGLKADIMSNLLGRG